MQHERNARCNKSFTCYYRNTSKKGDEKGIAKYGTALHHSLDHDWLQMSLEEKVDDGKYLICEMQRRKYIEEQLLKARNADSIERMRDLIDVALIELQKGRNHNAR